MTQEYLTRWNNKKEPQYLQYKEIEYIKVIPGKKWPTHGALTIGSGNGHHGNCVNCGLPLVTDLGYNSWEGTKCERKEERIVEIDVKIRWMKNKNNATKFTPEKAREVQMDFVRKQGWGEYCFTTKTV